MFPRASRLISKSWRLLAFGLPTIIKGAHVLGKKALLEQVPESVEAPSHSLSQSDLDLLMDIDKDVIVLFNLEELRENYQQQAFEFVEALRERYPNLVLITLKSKESFPFGQIDPQKIDEAFGVIRRRNDPDLEPFDHYTFFMKKRTISGFFESIPSINDLQVFNNLQKFELVVGVCEADRSKEKFIKKLSAKPVFSTGNMIYYNFESCQKLNGTNSDLFLIKKNSKTNSWDDTFATTIDSAKIDMIKLENFFEDLKKSGADSQEAQSDEQQPSPAELMIAENFKKMSIFTPSNFSDLLSTYYSVVLNVDLNKVTQREKKSLFKSMKQTITSMPPELASRVNFFYQPKKLQQEKFRVVAMNELYQNIRIVYQGQNTSKEMQIKLEKEYPFLLTQKNDSCVYKFEPKSVNWDGSELINFITDIHNDKVPCHYVSEEPKQPHYSHKMVLDTFDKIFADGKDHLIMYYSKNCPMCKRMFATFEELCRQNISEKRYPNLEMHRMNSIHNTSYPHSPVLAYYKKGSTKPYLFNHQHFSDQIIHDFVDVSYKTELAEFNPKAPCHTAE